MGFTGGPYRGFYPLGRFVVLRGIDVAPEGLDGTCGGGRGWLVGIGVGEGCRPGAHGIPLRME